MRVPSSSDNYRADPPEGSPHLPESHFQSYQFVAGQGAPQAFPEVAVQQRYAEQRQLLTHYLKEYLNELTRSPDSHLVVQQLVQQQPQAQELMQQWLQEQQMLHSQRPQDILRVTQQQDSPGNLFPHLPGQQSHLQKLVEQYQRLQKQGPTQTQSPTQTASQLPLSRPPAIANSQVNNLSSDVDTFNIVITKNLTGGQSTPTVQYLPDAQVSGQRTLLGRWSS